MSRQLIGQAADFTSTHRIGLSGDRERRCAGLANASGSEVGIDNGVAFVDSGAALVNALGKDADGFICRSKPLKKCLQVIFVNIQLLGTLVQGLRGAGARCLQCLLKSFRVVSDKIVIEGIAVIEPAEQGIKQKGITARTNRQLQIGQVGGGGSARVNNHHLHVGPRLFCRRHSLKQDRMRPRSITAYQN